jgi:Divergent InlB B-repeat domain
MAISPQNVQKYHLTHDAGRHPTRDDPSLRLKKANTMDRKRSISVIKWLATLAVAAASTTAWAQTPATLKTLVTHHGSLAAGDVTFTNFRLPLLQPGMLFSVGDTFPVLYDGADVSVQASVAADGKINLVLTPIDTATGLPKPYAVNAKPGAALPTDMFRYVEYDVVVTNPQRRLHGVDRAFGPGTTAVMGSIAQNAVMFFDTTQVYPFQYALVGDDIFAQGTEFGNAGMALLPNGDRAGARFAAVWGLISSDWGGIRVGNATLDSVSIRFTLADAVAPAVPVPLRVSGFFADAVYLSGPAPAGGATITLSSDTPSALTVPASVTVPQGAFYAAYRAQKQPVLNPTTVTVSGQFNSNISQALESVWVGEAVGSAPLPTLSVALTGKGKVTSAQRTINCGTVCSTTPVLGLGWTESLTATAGTGSVFSGWTGACSGTALTCSVIVNGLVNVGATFAALPATGGGGGGGASGFKLSVAKSNSGTVSSTPAGINCGSACTASYGTGNAVSLTATPPPGLAFLGWSGACSGAAPTCSVTMNADTKVQANFSK